MRMLEFCRLSLLAGSVSLLFCVDTAAAQPATIARATGIEGVTTSAAPPPHFDAVNAGDDDLSTYGFPPRPNAARDPSAYGKWAEAVGANPERLEPKLQRTVIFHGPRKAANTAIAAGSINWSGFVLDNGTVSWSSDSFATISADFIVPAVTARTCNNQWEYASIWAGLDGNASSDVLQAGVEADVICSATLGSTTYYAPWYEWYPNAEVRISNLATTAGVSFYVKVWATSATAGHAYLQNLSTKQAVSLNFSAPSGTRLRGESAEWVVETPMVGSTLSTLPIYGLDYLSTAIAWNLNGVGHAAGGVGAFDVTLARSGTTFSTAGLLGTEGVQYTSH